MNVRFKPLAIVFLLCVVVLAGIGVIFACYQQEAAKLKDVGETVYLWKKRRHIIV